MAFPCTAPGRQEGEHTLLLLVVKGRAGKTGKKGGQAREHVRREAVLRTP